MTHYDKITEITIQEQILNNLDNVAKFNELIDGIEDKTLPESENNLSVALLELAISGGVENVEKAKKIINKIDLSTFSDRDHYDMMWGIANSRRDGAREDPSFLVIEHMLKVGFNAGAVIENGINGKKTDLFDQIIRQSGFGSAKHSTDLAIIEAILETGSVAGFPKSSPVTTQTIEDLRNNTIEMKSLRNRAALYGVVPPGSSVEQAESVVVKPEKCCVIM